MQGVKTGDNRKKRKTRFFYWEGKLHKVLRINYPQNLVEAWCFKDRCRVSLLYTDWKRNSKKAIGTAEVARLLNISIRTIVYAFQNGEIRHPERSYPLDGTFTEKYMYWNEDHVMELHDALLEHHRGRPRKDGQITPNQSMASKAQIRAYFQDAQRVYVQNEDGQMVPLFEQRW